MPDIYMFFDNETTGLPKKFNAPVTDLENWPRIVQLAWTLCKEDGRHIVSRSYIIKPEGFIVPKEATAIHGIGHEEAVDKGVDLKDVITRFNDDAAEATHLVAHNIDFDINIVGAEILRTGVPSNLRGKPRLCTMKNSTGYCKIPKVTGHGYKWPKLIELYWCLFRENFDGAHNAVADVHATARCFFEMKKMCLFPEFMFKAKKKIVICDIDGTIANIDHRVHHLKNKPVDWDAFYGDMDKDKPIETVLQLIGTLSNFYDIVFATCRSERERNETLRWLKRYYKELTFAEDLILREADDPRSDTIVKLERVAAHNISPKEVFLVLEDRNKMVKAWRDAGYTCLQVAEGDF